VDQLVPWVVQGALPDQRETLTRRSAEHDVDVPLADSRLLAKFFPCHVDDALTHGRRVGEVELVGGAMNRVNFNGGDNVKTGRFKAEAEPPGACE